MERELEGREQRHLRIQTVEGAVDGFLYTRPGTSTVHYLNVAATSQNFLTLHPPVEKPDHWEFGDGPVSIATESIIFVVELAEFNPKPGDPDEAARFKRAPVRVRAGSFSIDGFVFVLPGGLPVDRISHDRRPFVPMTSVSVVGRDSVFAASFLAVNRSFVLAAQEIPHEQPDEAPARETATAEV